MDGNQRLRPAPPIAETGQSAVGLRQAIHDALHAYELATAARQAISMHASADRERRTSLVTALERGAAEELASAKNLEHETVVTEAARVETLARLADEIAEAAMKLLGSAALAHVRGVGGGIAVAVEPHTATDELAAATFAATATAAIDLRAALLRLARAYLDDRAWEDARSILMPVREVATGPLHDQATTLLYASYLDEAIATATGTDWEQALKLIDSALKVRPEGMRTDRVLADLFLRATDQLVAAAVAADRMDEAARHLAHARWRLGSDHPDLRRPVAGRTQLGWGTGLAVCLQEFGGHSLPVQDVAFAADWQLVSVDGKDIKRWTIPAAGSGTLINTIPAAGACKLTADAQLAVSPDGELRSTANGKLSGRLSGTEPSANSHLQPSARVAAFACTRDGSVMVWAHRQPRASTGASLRGASGYMPIMSAGADQAVFDFIRPLMLLQGNPPWMVMDGIAIEAPTPLPGSYSGEVHRFARARLVDLVKVQGGRAGSAMVSISLLPRPLLLDVAVAGTGEFVAWLHPGGEVVLADVANGVIRHTFQVGMSTTPYDSVAISPDSRLVVVAQASPTARPDAPGGQSLVTAWDVLTGREAWRWDVRGVVGAVAFSPDGRLLAALNTEGDIAFYDLRGQSPLGAIYKHGAVDYPCLAFAPDGSRLVTSGDRTLKVWGMPTPT
jgi:WD40 repeat protein